MCSGKDPAKFWQDSPEYHGALVDAGEVRLAVSPNGKRYLLQGKTPKGYYVMRWRKTLSALVPYLPEILAGDLLGLPDDPSQLPRPWSGEMAALSDKLAALALSGDKFKGEFVRSGDWRICVTPPRRVDGGISYMLQRRIHGRWRYVIQRQYRSDLRSLLGGPLPASHRAAGAALNERLLAGLFTVPEWAGHLAATAPEPLADSVKRKSRGLPRPRRGKGSPAA